MIGLHPDQQAIVEDAINYVKDARTGIWSCAGMAGTGKTTVLSTLAYTLRDDLGLRVGVASPTGKAAHVLNGKLKWQAPAGTKKLIRARTLHSMLSRGVNSPTAGLRHEREEIDERCEALKEVEGYSPRKKTDEHKALLARREAIMMEIKEIREREGGEMRFRPLEAGMLKEGYGGEDWRMPGCDVLLVDETSMVSEEFRREFIDQHSDVQILYFGDQNQLPPVKPGTIETVPCATNLSQATHTLREILRQGADSGILALAEFVAAHAQLPARADVETYDDVKCLGNLNKNLKDYALMFAEQDHTLVVWKNTTREAFGAIVREARKIVPHKDFPYLPVPGDTLIMAGRNDNARGILKGMEFIVQAVRVPDKWDRFRLSVDMVDQEDPDREFKDVTINTAEMQKSYGIEQKDKSSRDRDPSVMMRWGGVRTAHTAQGSEWAKVAYFDESAYTKYADRGRHIYTGITRASRQLAVCTRDSDWDKGRRR